MPFNGNDVQRLARIMTSNNQLPLSDMEQAAVIQELHNAFNQTTSEIAKLVNKSVATVEKLLLLSTANHDVQQEVKSGAVSVDVAVDRVMEYGEQAGKVLQHDKAVAAAQGKSKVTRSSIAPELSVKNARRFVELMAQATISDEGVFTLEGVHWPRRCRLWTNIKRLPKRVKLTACHNQSLKLRSEGKLFTSDLKVMRSGKRKSIAVRTSSLMGS